MSALAPPSTSDYTQALRQRLEAAFGSGPLVNAFLALYGQVFTSGNHPEVTRQQGRLSFWRSLRHGRGPGLGLEINAHRRPQMVIMVRHRWSWWQPSHLDRWIVTERDKGLQATLGEITLSYDSPSGLLDGFLDPLHR